MNINTTKNIDSLNFLRKEMKFDFIFKFKLRNLKKKRSFFFYPDIAAHTNSLKVNASHVK